MLDLNFNFESLEKINFKPYFINNNLNINLAKLAFVEYIIGLEI